MAPEDDSFDIESKSTAELYALLYKHFVLKGWQLGSIVGCALVVPALAVQTYRKGGRFTRDEFGSRALHAVARSACIGAGIVVVGGTARAVQAINTRDAVGDRVYRLHYNRGQSRTDLFANVGLAAGAAAAAAMFGPGAAALLGGGAAGTALGVVAHAATSEDLRRVPRNEWSVDKMK